MRKLGGIAGTATVAPMPSRLHLETRVKVSLSKMARKRPQPLDSNEHYFVRLRNYPQTLWLTPRTLMQKRRPS